MSRKNVLIALAVVLIGARGRRRQPLLQEGQGPDGHDRRHQDARSRGDRLGVGQDSAEAAGQHQRRHARAASSTSRSTKATAIKKGQFLLQIDPKSLRTRVDSGTASLQAAEASLEQMRQSVETARVQLDAGAAEPDAPAGSLDAAADDARSAREGGERRQGRRSRRCRSARSRSTPQASRIAQERADARERALRSEQGPHRIADRRHRHAPQHPGGRNRGHRHDEQRRHGAADAGRHVGDPGGSRGRRDQHPERAARADGEDHDRRAPRPDRSRATSPRSATARSRPPPARPRHAGDQLQGGRRSSTSRCPTCGPASPARPTSRRRRARTSSRCRFRPSPSASWSTTRTARS